MSKSFIIHMDKYDEVEPIMFWGTYEEASKLYPNAYSIEQERF